jgi:hypothetical protein
MDRSQNQGAVPVSLVMLSLYTVHFPKRSVKLISFFFFFLLLASFNTLNILTVCEYAHVVKNRIKTVYSMVEVAVHLRFEHLK